MDILTRLGTFEGADHDLRLVARALKLVEVNGICLEPEPNTFALNAKASADLNGVV